MNESNTQPDTPAFTDKPSFECNICLELPRYPIVTRCGHLYCWNCLSTWLEKGTDDCPVCKSRVDQDKVIPVYGRGDGHGPRNSGFPAFHRATESSSGGHRNRRGYLSLIIEAFPFIPFWSMYNSSREATHGRVNLTHDESRRQAITHFFIFLGMIMIIVVISS
jgi:E3 ubiquitin-protein ligase RNF5